MPKPLDRLRLKRALDDVASLYDQRRRVRALEEQLLRDLEFHGIVGKSPVMLEVFDFARKVARHYTNVLLVGPTGTGKELVARAIHQLSPVSQQRLSVCNCSAMVDTAANCSLPNVTQNVDSDINTKDSTPQRDKIFDALRREFHFEVARPNATGRREALGRALPGLASPCPVKSRHHRCSRACRSRPAD